MIRIHNNFYQILILLKRSVSHLHRHPPHRVRPRPHHLGPPPRLRGPPPLQPPRHPRHSQRRDHSLSSAS